MLRVVSGPLHIATAAVHSPVLERWMSTPAASSIPRAPRGFATCRRYALLPYVQSGREDPAIRWLQAMEPPFHTFIVAEPWSVFPTTSLRSPTRTRASSDAPVVRRANLYAIMTVSHAAH